MIMIMIIIMMIVMQTMIIMIILVLHTTQHGGLFVHPSPRSLAKSEDKICFTFCSLNFWHLPLTSERAMPSYLLYILYEAESAKSLVPARGNLYVKVVLNRLKQIEIRKKIKTD